ncbi:hypothetical protein [Streptomyces brevispora]|uniref:hypothetical protein n=1 Tax=Streptomyces brevispora TaxID=887462 RepID=UPI00382EA15A
MRACARPRVAAVAELHDGNAPRRPLRPRSPRSRAERAGLTKPKATGAQSAGMAMEQTGMEQLRDLLRLS